MDNPSFDDEENTSMVNQNDEENERYDTPNVSKIDETSLTVPDTEKQHQR